MTTSVRNVSFDTEVFSFMAAKPSPPLNLSLALTDLLQVNGPEFIATPRGKALLHSLMKASHGNNYKVDGKTEQQKLKSTLLPTRLQKVTK